MLRLCSLAAAGIWAGVACAGAPAPEPPPAPAPPAADAAPASGLTPGRVSIADLRGLGPYLGAELRGRGGAQGFLFVASDACQSVLREGAEARLEPVQPLGRLVDDAGRSCLAHGMLGLAGWRDALPERRADFLVVSGPAELRLVQASDGILLAAGKLPLALELRWTKPLDVVALLPDTPACHAHLARPRTVLEFRPRGPDALVLRGRLEPCAILGLAEPIYLDLE